MASANHSKIARELVIHGRVQGVFFRAFVRSAAEAAGVAGNAENRSDGTVAAHLEGEPDAVARVEQACRTGPEKARVDHVESTDVPPKGLTGFSTA